MWQTLTDINDIGCGYVYSRIFFIAHSMYARLPSTYIVDHALQLESRKSSLIAIDEIIMNAIIFHSSLHTGIVILILLPVAMSPKLHPNAANIF